MRGFQPAKKAKPFANGGPVRGPGTGTSDEVQAEVPEGTYIMPADSTQAVGQDQLAAMGTDANGVPVNLSNGEFKLPPEQVHAVGVQALDQMKDATHQPVARGFGPGVPQESPEPRMFFVNGGVVEDERKRNSFGDAAAANTNPGVSPPASVVRQPAPAWSTGAPAPAPAPVQPLNELANPATAAQTVAGAQQAQANWEKSVNSIPGQDVAPGQVPQRPAPTPAAPQNPALEAQRQSDRAKIGAAWDTLKDVNDDAGRAIADVAMLVPRGLAGAYDTAVIRPMRAAGLNASYISPSLVPDGVDPSSMTPFTDQKRMQQAASSVPAAPGTPAAQASAATAKGPTNAPAPGAKPAPAATQPPAAPAAAPQTSGATPAATAAAPADGTINGFAPVAGLSGVYRRGNEYTDSPGGSVTASGMPAAVSVGNMNAIGNGVIGMPTTRGFAPQPQSGPSVIEIPDPRVADQARRERDQVIRTLTTPVQGARGLTAAQRNGLLTLMNQEQQAQQAADRNATALQQTEMQTGTQRDMALMREIGDTGRASMREQGENTRSGARNAIDAGRLDLDRQARGLEIRSGQRQEKLYERYEAAKTPEERAAIAQQIRDLSGKATNPKDDLMVVGGGQEWDSTANVMRNVPQRVFDARSRQFVDAGQGQAGQAPKTQMPPPASRPIGSVSTVNGKSARWDGKQWVPMP